MAWNDDFTDADWTSLSVINMFLEALWERERACGATSGSVPTKSAGDDVQLATLWSGMQNSITGMLNSGVWVVEGEDPDGTPTDPDVDWTEAQLDPGLRYANAAQGFTAVGLSGWTRKRPREIALTSSTADTLGNTAADGMRAVLVGNCQQIYLRTSGAWVLDSFENGGPDIVTATGAMEAGDYVGAWVFNEIRDMLNLLIATFEYPSSAAAATVYSSLGVSYDPGGSASAALSDATSSYASTGPTGSFNFKFIDITNGTGSASPGYSAGLGASKASFAATTENHRSRSINFYAAICVVRHAFNDWDSDDNLVFDAQGAPVSQAVTKYATTSVASGTSTSSAQSISFDPSTPPSSADTSISVSDPPHHNWNGWFSTQQFVIVHWDFTYVSA